mgnify:CR=1 FL=1
MEGVHADIRARGNDEGNVKFGPGWFLFKGENNIDRVGF